MPAVALVSHWIGQPLELGMPAGATVLMALGFVGAMITYGTGRTNLLSGIVHLVLMALTSLPCLRPEPRAAEPYPPPAHPVRCGRGS